MERVAVPFRRTRNSENCSRRRPGKVRSCRGGFLCSAAQVAQGGLKCPPLLQRQSEGAGLFFLGLLLGIFQPELVPGEMLQVAVGGAERQAGQIKAHG